MAAPTYDITGQRMFPAQIEIDGTPLGGTRREDSVTLRLPVDYEDLGYAQAGSRRTEAVIVGDDCELVTSLSELSFENLVKIFPGWTHIEDGQDEAIEMVPRVGLQFGRDEHDVEIVIKPIIGGQVTTNKNYWITLYRAFPMTPAAELQFALREQQRIEVTWGTLPDPTKGNSRGRIGSPDATASS